MIPWCSFPNGHYYSPVPSLEELEKYADRIYREPPRSLPGIDMRESEQMALMEELAVYYPEISFPEQKTPESRYYFVNEFYLYSDAIFLYSFMRHFRPRRIVDVGVGFSTAAIMDVSDKFFGGSIEHTVIDPDFGRLRTLLFEGDERRLRMFECRAQDVALEEFMRLEPGDFLVVDSSHVVKIGSDMQYLFFDVIPRLPAGVFLHFHDVFWPFEYLRCWTTSGLGWNEAYVLRAMLQGGSRYSVMAMNMFLERYHEDFFKEKMPGCLKQLGASIWICKIED